MKRKDKMAKLDPSGLKKIAAVKKAKKMAKLKKMGK